MDAAPPCMASAGSADIVPAPDLDRHAGNLGILVVPGRRCRARATATLPCLQLNIHARRETGRERLRGEMHAIRGGPTPCYLLGIWYQSAHQRYATQQIAERVGRGREGYQGGGIAEDRL